jgi:4-hydroxyproline epimerase
VKQVRVIDSHTEGEPTRVVIAGAPYLVGDTLDQKALDFRENHSTFRTGVVLEPRGSEAVVGALLLPPQKSTSQASVIFFNNVGVLGMCGHGTIGLVRTLQYLGRLQPGKVAIDTLVGTVEALLHEDARVTIWNVPSYRYKHNVSLTIPGFGDVTGDIAYGGNWFFATSSDEHELTLANLSTLTRFTAAIRHQLETEGITGESGALIDHIELFGPPKNPDNNSRNFVLCPGMAYDRSPCGTGLSAKLACLAAEGSLQPGQIWRQESVIGSLFEGQFSPLPSDKRILPQITSRAYITGDNTLIFDPDDPFREGIRP